MAITAAWYQSKDGSKAQVGYVGDPRFETPRLEISFWYAGYTGHSRSSYTGASSFESAHERLTKMGYEKKGER